MSPPVTLSESDPIPVAPAPWKTKCTSWIIPLWTSGATARDLPVKAYSPLEAGSSYASEASGKAQRSMGLIMLVRYTETPVGPYDEIVLVPGVFSYPFEDKKGKRTAKTARRITRIYVSQKHTTWNGRKNWNIPKHLARFEWVDNANGSQTVKVYPHDTSSVPYDPAESTPAAVPFFTCTLQPVKYTPSFPFKSTWLSMSGLDLTLVQPPLPDATAATKHGELAGSEMTVDGDERWCEVTDFYQASDKASLEWVDLGQGEKKMDEYDNFWPGMTRWVVGVKLSDGVVDFGVPETWATPKSLL